ncbi:MAG: carboxypeptidase regulatory-like domain-containing protein [Ignavibacteriaceae bacterium]|nr:carboxypeptidase regulatory-like domain-containing protein [Ignavibacteriaceae bacterium]
MKKLLLLFSVSFLIIFLSCKKDDNNPTTPSNGTIQGKVTNITGDTVIVNANVSTNPSTSSVSTNALGEYTISDVAVGTYTVTATKGGYTSGNVSVSVTAGKTTTANIQMSIQTGNILPTQGLVAYYPFNGNANDESGNGNNGTVNGATLSSDRFGNANKAYSFNGTSNYIEVLDNPTLRFTNSFSISLWVSLTSPYRLNYNMTLLGKSLGSTYRDSYTIYTGYWGAGVRSTCTGSGTISGGEEGITSTFGLEISTWYNTTWAFDKTSNQQSLYINGNLIKSQSISYSIDYDNHPLAIGRGLLNGSFAEFLDGKLDDIRIYNRALNATEIQQLYTEGGYVPPSSFSDNFNDGDFTNNPEWTANVNSSGCQLGTISVINGELKANQTNSSGCSSGSFIKINVNIPLSDSTKIQFDVKPTFSDVEGGAGVQNDEYPAVINLWLATSNVDTVVVRLAYNYRGGASWTGAKYIVVAFPACQQNVWRRNEQFVIRNYVPNAVKIVKLQAGGQGWNFEGYFDNIRIVN